jgi:hypothetical protein
MSQILGAFGLPDLAMLLPILGLAHVFETYELFISLIFKFLFEPRGKPCVLNQ